MMPLLRAEFRRYPRLLNQPLLHNRSQVLYLPFDRDDGSYARDRSGYSNHGVIYGAQHVAGKIGEALSFDGVDDYVNCGVGLSGLGSGAFTISAWVYARSLGTGSYPGIVYRQYFGNILLCIAAAARKWYFYTGSAGRPFKDVFSDDTIAFNVWTHIAVLRDEGNVLRMFVNGVQQEDTDIQPDDLSGTDKALMIGRYTTNYFDGLIDEVRIYNKALTQAEIQRLMFMRGI